MNFIKTLIFTITSQVMSSHYENDLKTCIQSALQAKDENLVLELTEDPDWQTLVDAIYNLRPLTKDNLLILKNILFKKAPDLESFLETFYQKIILRNLQYGSLAEVESVLSLDLPKYYYGYLYKADYTLVHGTITSIRLSMNEQLNYIVKYRRNLTDLNSVHTKEVNLKAANLIEDYLNKKWKIDISDTYYPKHLGIKYKKD